MIKIKKATKKDIPSISRLLKEKYKFSSIKDAKSVFIGEYKYCHFRIAFDNDKVVGLVGWRMQGATSHGVIELTRIAVLSSVTDVLFTKEMLFDVMIAEADYFYKKHNEKLRKVFSMIHADNKHIKDFLLNKGMEQEAILRNHYHFGTDELVFSMFL